MRNIENKPSFRLLRHGWWIIGVAVIVGACRDQDPGPSGNAVTADVRDSVYYWSKEVYLWAPRLPDRASFNPLGYASPEDVIEKVRTYSPLGAGGQPNDRFSFVLPKTDWDNIEAGTESDLGVGFKYASATDLRVAYVYAQSSAGKQGVARGWRVLRVNGTEANVGNQAVVNRALAQTDVTISFEKSDGTQQTLALRTDAYQTNPVLSRKVLAVGSQKVGYVAFNTFLGNTAVEELQAAFNDFKSEAITDLVVDLRYNGGGSTTIMEGFANLLMPANAVGKVMYTMQWNERYAQRLNRTIPFAGVPSGLNLSRVVFITTRRTASASELLINSLRPYVNVKLIGETTVGKPVGFPVIPIRMSASDPSQNYVVAPVAFQNVNADNFGDYFDGIAVDKTVADDLTRDFGDASEACLSAALQYLDTGNLRLGAGRSSPPLPEPAVREANRQLDHGRQGLYYPMH
ncbi:MAG: hypothetical protein H7Z75_10820 [Ferruginibacter sp.]|nr:hypothetical protein [Cytophagales bacterium]